jgi:hypothetical protein
MRKLCQPPLLLLLHLRQAATQYNMLCHTHADQTPGMHRSLPTCMASSLSAAAMLLPALLPPPP